MTGANAEAGSPGPFDHHRGAKPLLRETGSLRGFLFVGANLAAFVAINAFMYYLSTGRWADFSAQSYRQALASPLSGLLLHPLSIFTHPWMVLVTGILVAAVIFVPAMIAVLYRLWVSMLFVSAVALVGHAPLLSVFQVIGCLLAARTRLRSDLPFVALLAGLAAPSVYLYFFSGSSEQVLSQMGKLVFYFPFILALMASVLAGIVVLALARLTQYRPGVIWPIMLLFLVTPPVLFYTKVGPAELEYAVLTGEVAAGDGIFAPQMVEDFLESQRARSPGQDEDAWVLANRDLARRRQDLKRRCDEYICRRPQSPRVPAVMWLRAAVMDTRIDAFAFRGGRINYVSRDPSLGGESEECWRQLLKEPRASTPQGLIARQRLAIQDLRRGEDLAGAAEELAAAAKGLNAHLSAKSVSPADIWNKVFQPTEPLPGDEYYRAVRDDASRLLWLIQRNKVVSGGKLNAQAFAEYMRHWPFRNESAQELDELANRYEGTAMADNFRFQAAMAVTHEMERAGRLAKLAQVAFDSQGGLLNEAALEANYQLGRLAVRLGDTPAWSAARLRTAGEYFDVVVRGPESPDTEAARQEITWQATTRAAATQPAKPKRR